MDSDNENHFMANIFKELMKALNMKWKYHTPWHPPSSGKVERMSS
jgi:hypothetical protein